MAIHIFSHSIFLISILDCFTEYMCAKRERKHDEMKRGREGMRARTRAQCLWQQGRRGKLQLPSTFVCTAGLYHPLPHFNMAREGLEPLGSDLEGC